MGFGAELGRVYIEVRAKLDKLKGDFDKATAEAETAMQGMGQKLSKHGDRMSKTLTPVAGAFALASKAAFGEWDAGADVLVSKTGAVGDELESLEGSMRKVAGSTTLGFEAVANTVGDLNTMLGLTGKPLEDIATKITKLQELGQPVDPQKFARFMGDWSIANDQAGSSLDRLYTISQNTGQGVDELLDLIVQFGAPLRSLGFDVETSSLMLAKWHKEGVNVETLLAGMKMGLGKIAKGMGGTAEATLKAEQAQVAYDEAVAESGEESAEAQARYEKLQTALEGVAQSAGTSIPEEFQKIIASIGDASTESEAFEIAISRFGLRAGPDFARAVLEGRFELEELEKATANSTGSVDKAYKATLDWGDKLEMLKNRVIGAVGPMGEYGMAIGGIAAGIGPILSVGGRLITHFTRAGTAAAAATAPTLAQGAASATAGGMAAAGSGGFMAFAAGLWATLAPVLAVVAVIGLLVAAGWLLVKNWDDVKRGIGVILDWLLEHWKWVVGAILAVVLGPLGLAIGLIIGHWDKVKEAGGRALGWLKDRWDDFTGFITGIPGRIGDALGGLWSGLLAGFRAAWNPIARTINGIDFTIPSWIPGFGGKTFGLPDLPMLAEGGRATQAGLAVVGERGKETVWLPAGAEVDKRSRGRGPGGGGPTYIVQGSLVTERQLRGMGRNNLADVKRYNGSTGV